MQWHTTSEALKQCTALSLVNSIAPLAVPLVAGSNQMGLLSETP